LAPGLGMHPLSSLCPAVPPRIDKMTISWIGQALAIEVRHARRESAYGKIQ
jgi:hypothetical protein